MTSEPDTGPRPHTLLVFAKAPRPGGVKTRLAQDVGDTEACRIYREMGRQIVDQVRDGPYRTIICYAPDDAEEELAGWLSVEDPSHPKVGLRPQGAGGLGQRLVSTFEGAFRDSDRVCVIGTDAPEVDEEVVNRALQALDRADLVIGPARDGGYYLLALKAPCPELFQNIPWSTPEVLASTLEAAERLGLDIIQLKVLSDVDVVGDLGERYG